MSYCNIADVKSLFRHFSDNTDAAVSDSDISSYIENYNAYINSRLYGLYLLPITESSNPESFKILSQINSFYVASVIDDILNNYSQADKKPSWEKRAAQMLESVAPQKDSSGKQPEPNSKLIDATYLGTNVQKGKFKANSIDSTTFKKGSDTW